MLYIKQKSATHHGLRIFFTINQSKLKRFVTFVATIKQNFMATKLNILDEGSKNSRVSSVVKIFENPEFGKVRTVIIDNTPWFVGNDVAIILGYKYPKDAIRDNVDEEDKRIVQLSDIQDGESGSLPDHMRGSKISIINESGLYSLILRSDKPEAKRFKRWITSEVLPSIRKTGSYSVKKEVKIPDVVEGEERVKSIMVVAKGFRELLKASDASVAAYINKGIEPMNLPPIEYVPSKGVKFSATALLKQFGRKESINLFNARMEELGYLATKQRKSTSSKTGVKNFKCLIEKGLEFGENMVSPHNEKETQPHYYESRFQELLDILFGK